MKTAGFLALIMTVSTHGTDYSQVIPAFEKAVHEEMATWQLGGIAVAWVDGTKTVYEAGFGEATKDSVFRAGSVSKLFNAVAIMQLVESGRVDLDAAIDSNWLPENPFAGTPPITLRQILCHRSGLQREATVGGYFDPSEPGLARTVASLRGSALVTPPNAMTRYSNIGPSLAGHLAAEAAGMSFETWQAEHIFAPLGMTHSAWFRRDIPADRMIRSHMRVADGAGGFNRITTPLFDLGTVPAGNLYTTAGDLARFLAMWADDGNAPGGRVLKPGTLAEMWKPQLDEKGGFGLGFALDQWQGRKTVGHGGAVFGHSTALTFLPDEKIGVVVLCNEDIVSGRTQRLANLALSLMLEARLRRRYQPACAGRGRQSGSAEAGRAGRGLGVPEFLARARDRAGEICAAISPPSPACSSRSIATRFLLRSRIHDDVPVSLERDAPAVSSRPGGRARRDSPACPQRGLPSPEAWRGFLGSYGPDFIPLVVHEKFGHLYATTENMVDYRLTPVNRHVFQLPPGMYVEEEAVFLAAARWAPLGSEFRQHDPAPVEMTSPMKLRLHDIHLPMRHPFTIALGTTTVQHNLLVELEEGGVRGYGEGASSHAWSEYHAGIDARRARSGAPAHRGRRHFPPRRNSGTALQPVLGEQPIRPVRPGRGGSRPVGQAARRPGVEALGP